ncbi:serine/threonine-protein kinase PRP4 homolog isoform X2 [Cydia splendana]|uniref:serine/threonine-protein kinase PRP4 homolog isoform X2 n=1 Tax=Cydia splendana TaxID=1100963 RepID=UPI00300CE843
MSKKPYVTQEDSPNLVIVPIDNIDTLYEPPPKKVKESDAPLPAPTPSINSHTSVFARKSGAKLNFSGRNNDVLIDVRKVQRSPTSWATNYLQSIGGTSTKFDRIYCLASKPTSHLTHTETIPGNRETTLPNTLIQHQTNTQSDQIIMEKKNSQPKININLIKPKPVPQPTIAKETGKPNCNTNNNISTSTTDVRKEPSLPKNYKIPMQSKYNKLSIHPVTDKETARPNITNSICIQNSIIPKKQAFISSSKNNNEIIKTNHYKISTPTTATTKQIADKNKNKKPNQLKHELNNSQYKNNQDKAQVKINKNTEQPKNGNEIKQLKKKVTVQHIDKQYTTKCVERMPPKYKETHQSQPVNNKENDQPKHVKVIKQLKAIKETTKPRDYKDPSPSRNTNENITRKTNEAIIAHIKTIKDMYKLKNKKEPTFSTKLKTKKEHISDISKKVSKLEKHTKSKDSRSQEIQSKKPKDKPVINKETHLPRTVLTKEDINEKLKKKRATEKKTGQGEYSGSKTKKIKLSSPDTNTAKMTTCKSVHDERLSKSISPIKSVVSRIKTDPQSHNSEKYYHKESGYYHSHYEKISTKKPDYHCQNSEKLVQRGLDVDLRTKLKCKYPKIHYRKEDYNWNHIHKKDKFTTVPNGDRFVPEENLIISFNAEDDNEEKPTMKKSPVKKLARKQSSPKDKKCKKIKLEINIVFGHGDSSDEESTKGEVETMENMDLSFLDDFNVDEIAESLNECKDCTRKMNEEETVGDINAQHIISNNNTIIEAMASEESVIFNTNESMCKDEFAENKTEYRQEPTLSACCEETQNTIKSDISTGLDNTTTEQSASPGTKTDIFQNYNSEDNNVRALSSEVPTVNTSSENCTNSDHNRNIPIDKAQESTAMNMSKANVDIEINDNKNLITMLENNSERAEKTHTDNDLLLVKKMDHSDIIKQHLSSEIPVATSNSDSNIYSDHNDLIDALQDNSNVEINAIKSFIASMNNNTDENNVKRSEVEKSSAVTKYSNTPYKTKIKQMETVKTSDHNTTEILTCIKPDPDVILIEDSDSEHETEVNNKQPTKDENAENIQPNQVISPNKKDEVRIIEPAGENSKSILILDTNEEDLQSAKETCPVKSDEVITIEPTGVNSESVLILDTDYDIEESIDTSQLDESNQDANSENITMVEQRKPGKTALKDTCIEIKTNTNTEINSESEKTLIQDKVTNKTQHGTTSIHSKDKKDNLQDTIKVAGNTDTKTSDKPPSKKPTAADDIPENFTPDTKTQNVSTKLDTKAHNKEKEVDKDSEHPGVERSRCIANNKFIQTLESEMFLYLGEKCIVTDVIRYGKYSKIYRCKDSSKLDYAIKVLKKHFDGYNVGLQKQNMMMELQNGVPENNLNCVRLITGFVASGLWCYLMEYYPMNLQQAIVENKRSFHIDHVQILSRQLVSAVTILRNNNIIHSDIKPSHILINSSQTRIKLCGFDQATYFKDSNLLPNTGTVNYRAPELILGYPAGYGIDVWSTALVMYEMATYRKLFPGFYNNNILYQQLCSLGAIPMEMLMESKFRNAHFRGTAFTKIVGSKEKIIINEIEFNGRLNATLYQVYTADWGKERDVASKREDKRKLRAFLDLLHNMLVMHPRCRIAIEFVFANPFIYESFDDC